MLEDLNLSGNPIKVIEHLNLPQLKSLTMDSCKLRQIENLRVVKKLQYLSLKNNLIEDPSIQGGAQQLIDLKQLLLSGNQIQQIRYIYGYPGVSFTFKVMAFRSKNCT